MYLHYLRRRRGIHDNGGGQGELLYTTGPGPQISLYREPFSTKMLLTISKKTLTSDTWFGVVVFLWFVSGFCVLVVFFCGL